MTTLLRAVVPSGGDTLAPAAARTGVLLAMIDPVWTSFAGPPADVAALGGRRTRATALTWVGLRSPMVVPASPHNAATTSNRSRRRQSSRSGV